MESGKTSPQKIGSSNVLDLRGFELLWDQTLQICEAVVILFKERDWNKKIKERGRNVHLILVVKGGVGEGQGRGMQKQ